MLHILFSPAVALKSITSEEVPLKEAAHSSVGKALNFSSFSYKYSILSVTPTPRAYKMASRRVQLTRRSSGVQANSFFKSTFFQQIEG